MINVIISFSSEILLLTFQEPVLQRKHHGQGLDLSFILLAAQKSTQISGSAQAILWAHHSCNSRVLNQKFCETSWALGNGAVRGKGGVSA
jgi:hypothetical protein